MPSLCPRCGITLPDASGICSRHIYGAGDACIGDGYTEGWARANRIMCDFFHRGKTLPRVVEPAGVHSIFISFGGAAVEVRNAVDGF